MLGKSIFRLPLLLTGVFIVFLGAGYYASRKGVFNKRCANTLSCKESLEFSVQNDEEAVFNGETFKPPVIEMAQAPSEEAVLATETSVSEKRIEVDLTTQTLKAYEGDTIFMESKISSGKIYPTPTGEFTIWRKIRATLMAGGEGSGYYYLPNVPYVMFFSNSDVAAGRGFSIHGTYWHDNFGHAMSHGCVNMKTRDAKKLYEWVDPPTSPEQRQSKPGEVGTKIIIYGKAP